MRKSCYASKSRSPATNLLILDELGFVPLSKTGAELLFEMLSQRYEWGSTMVTSNLPFAEWTEILGSERLTGAYWIDLPITFISSR
jgi:DNA replication protein DnaC